MIRRPLQEKTLTDRKLELEPGSEDLRPLTPTLDDMQILCRVFGMSKDKWGSAGTYLQHRVARRAPRTWLHSSTWRPSWIHQRRASPRHRLFESQVCRVFRKQGLEGAAIFSMLKETQIAWILCTGAPRAPDGKGCTADLSLTGMVLNAAKGPGVKPRSA